MSVVFSVGISGCGKSTYYYNNLKDTHELIEPDLIRKEFGDINDQSRNNEVFVTAYRRLDKLLKEGKNVYFSATNLNLKSIKKIVRIAKDYTSDITCVIFKDSYDWELCLARVRTDLKNGVDRSNSDITKTQEDGTTIHRLEEMCNSFKSLMDNDEFKDFVTEQGIKIIIV